MNKTAPYIYREYEEPSGPVILQYVDECDRLVAAIKYFGLSIPAEIFDEDRGI
ncbi:MAG: hypothetical protein ACOCX9_02745 [Spirochaetota bacterium]